MRQSKILLPFIFLLLLLTVFSRQIPFFWDSAFFSSLSVHFYDNGFDGFIGPEALDTGGFPLYSVYMTLVWKIFGKTLLVSHFAMFPFLVGLLFEFYKLCKRYLNEKTIIWALILFIVEPVFLTQSILMGYDILIAYFFILALNALYQQKNILFSIALLLLCFVSIRGIMLAGALFILNAVQENKISFSFFLKYIPTGGLLLFWAFYHNQQTGWYVFSPFREEITESFVSAEMTIRQFGYIIWKNLDLGRAALWLILAFIAAVYFKKQKSQEYRELMSNLFIPLVMLTIFMILIFNPIGHKYFLTVFILLNVAVCYCIQQVLIKKSRIILFSLLIVSLTAGNFILYPQRYGNAWDSSLKILPFFKIQDEMNRFISEKHIPGDHIYSQFPLTTNARNAFLSDTDFAYTDIENDKIETCYYFLYSNIINTGRIEDLEKIKQSWIVTKELKSGTTELILYQNPQFPSMIYE